MFTTVILILTLFFILLYALKVNSESYWRRRNIHFERPLPFFGNIIDIILYRKSLSIILEELYFKIDQPFFGVWTFNEPQLIIKSPDLIKRILVKDFDYFQDRNITCREEIDEFLANMMFLMENPKWKMTRAEVSPVLSITQIKRIYPQIQIVAKDMVRHINTLNGAVPVKKLCVDYVGEAVCSSVFGVDMHNFQNKNSDSSFELDISILSEIPIILHLCKSSLAKVLKVKPIGSAMANKLYNFLKYVLAKRKYISNWKRINLLDILLRSSRKHISGDVEIMSISAEFLIAAYQSTSTIIALVLYELTLNKSIQNRLRKEIITNVEADGDISLSALNTMSYMSKVVFETLRKYPVIPVLGRKCVKDYQIPNTAVTIEKGINILIPLSALQNDPKYFPEPETFDPNRFSKDDIRERHYYSYLPFGEGPRKCIGMKFATTIIKLGVAYIIKNFEIESHDKIKSPLLSNVSNTVLMVDDKVCVRFIPITEINKL